MDPVYEKILMSLPQPTNRKNTNNMKRLGNYNSANSKRLGMYNTQNKKKLGVYN